MQDKQTLPVGKVVIYGAVIGIAAIGLFAAIWWGLGTTAASDWVRLISAICVPPLVIMIIVFVVYLRRSE